MAAQHKLDVYVPAGAAASSSLPVVVCVHGGGWMRGDHQNAWRGAPRMARTLARRGFVVVTPSYRLAPSTWSFALVMLALVSSVFGIVLASILKYSIGDSTSLAVWFGGCAGGFALLLVLLVRCCRPGMVRSGADAAAEEVKARFPAQAHDVASAVQWSVSKIRELVPRADTQAVFLLGHSAGGHLVSLLALDESLLANVGVARDKIRGVATISGIYRVAQPLSDCYWHPMNCLFRNVYAAGVFEGDAWTAASPAYHLESRADDDPLPPFLILQAARREYGLDADGRYFHQALTSRRHSATYEVIDGVTHATIPNFEENGLDETVAAWMRSVMQPASMLDAVASRGGASAQV